MKQLIRRLFVEPIGLSVFGAALLTWLVHIMDRHPEYPLLLELTLYFVGIVTFTAASFAAEKLASWLTQ